MNRLDFFSVISVVTLTCLATACGGGSGSGSGGSGGTGGSSPECGNGQVEDGEDCDDGAENSDTAACTSTCKKASCGDSFVQAGVEECDAGDKNSDTGACTAACKNATCGDSLVQEGVEECDQGDQNSDTGACTAACKSATCGDSLVQAGVEDCDQGDQNSDTGACTTACKDAACGDGLVQTGVEECDQGAQNSDTGACTLACKDAVCGDMLVQAGVEGCDDGNMVDNDTCTNACTLPACGDGIQQAGEECDLGAQNNDNGACTTLCKNAACGDGFVQTGVEQCDMGAQNSNTGACTLTCKNAVCGDSLVQAGVEECDLGAQNANTAACTLACKNAKCGDGFIRTGVEACDDANMVQGDGCNNDCVVSGSTIWTQTYNGGANLADGWNAVATDSAGNIYVTGFEGTAAQGFNAIVRKYNSAGAVQWTYQYNGAGNGNDEGNGIALDAQGAVYVTGYGRINATETDVLMLKLDGATGGLLWVNTIAGGVTGADVGMGVAVNPANGNVYIAGLAYTAANVGSDLFVAKINPANGQLVWSDITNGAGNLDDFGGGITVDTAGAVIATGGVRTAANYDIWVRKYTDNGVSFAVQWTRTFNGASNNDDAAYAIASDGSNNVIVGGLETVTGQANNAWVRKYDSAGNTVWTQTFASATALNDRSYGVKADSTGAVVACGFQAVANNTADVWVRRYTAAGVAQWTQGYNGNADQDDLANGCAFDPSGNVIVAGYETVTGPNNNAWLRKYAP